MHWMAHLDREDVTVEPRPLMENILDTGTRLCQLRHQVGDAARAIADGGHEANESAIGCKTPLHAAP